MHVILSELQLLQVKVLGCCFSLRLRAATVRFNYFLLEIPQVILAEVPDLAQGIREAKG